MGICVRFKLSHGLKAEQTAPLAFYYWNMASARMCHKVCKVDVVYLNATPSPRPISKPKKQIRIIVIPFPSHSPLPRLGHEWWVTSEKPAQADPPHYAKNQPIIICLGAWGVQLALRVAYPVLKHVRSNWAPSFVLINTCLLYSSIAIGEGTCACIHQRFALKSLAVPEPKCIPTCSSFYIPSHTLEEYMWS